MVAKLGALPRLHRALPDARWKWLVRNLAAASSLSAREAAEQLLRGTEALAAGAGAAAEGPCPYAVLAHLRPQLEACGVDPSLLLALELAFPALPAEKQQFLKEFLELTAPLGREGAEELLRAELPGAAQG